MRNNKIHKAETHWENIKFFFMLYPVNNKLLHWTWSDLGLEFIRAFSEGGIPGRIYLLVTEYKSWPSSLGMGIATYSKYRTDFPVRFAEMASMGFDSTRIIH